MKKNSLFFTILIITLFLDIITKYLIVKFEPSFNLPFFSLVNIQNTGALFGYFQGFQILFIIIGFVVLYGVYHYYSSFKNTPSIVGLSLITAGAIGNLLDRIFRGHVVDFLDFFLGNYHWPAFNISDTALVVGVILLLIYYKK